MGVSLHKTALQECGSRLSQRPPFSGTLGDPESPVLHFPYSHPVWRGKFECPCNVCWLCSHSEKILVETPPQPFASSKIEFPSCGRLPTCLLPCPNRVTLTVGGEEAWVSVRKAVAVAPNPAVTFFFCCHQEFLKKYEDIAPNVEQEGKRVIHEQEATALLEKVGVWGTLSVGPGLLPCPLGFPQKALRVGHSCDRVTGWGRGDRGGVSAQM